MPLPLGAGVARGRGVGRDRGAGLSLGVAVALAVDVVKWAREDCVVAVKAVSDASSSAAAAVTIFRRELFLNLGLLCIWISLDNKLELRAAVLSHFSKHCAFIGVRKSKDFVQAYERLMALFGLCRLWGKRVDFA